MDRIDQHHVAYPTHIKKYFISENNIITECYLKYLFEIWKVLIKLNEKEPLKSTQLAPYSTCGYQTPSRKKEYTRTVLPWGPF